jgi:hypothetical protein
MSTLEKNPLDRPASMSRVREDLQDILANLSNLPVRSPSKSASVKTTAGPQKNKAPTKTWLVLATLFLAVVLGVAVILAPGMIFSGNKQPSRQDGQSSHEQASARRLVDEARDFARHHGTEHVILREKWRAAVEAAEHEYKAAIAQHQANGPETEEEKGKRCVLGRAYHGQADEFRTAEIGLPEKQQHEMRVRVIALLVLADEKLTGSYTQDDPDGDADLWDARSSLFGQAMDEQDKATASKYLQMIDDAYKAYKKPNLGVLATIEEFKAVLARADNDPKSMLEHAKKSVEISENVNRLAGTQVIDQEGITRRMNLVKHAEERVAQMQKSEGH